MKIRTLCLASTLALSGLAASTPVSASPITGIELGTAVHWNANSTNELNFLLQTPGRVGQVAPFVILEDATPTSITLEFNNAAAGLAFFEIRIDGVDTGTTNHPNPLLNGLDTIHSGGVSVTSGTLGLVRTFNATDMVEVRLALGGERDWDFNWTAFDVQPAPEPATLSLLGLGMLGFGAARRRIRRS